MWVVVSTNVDADLKQKLIRFSGDSVCSMRFSLSVLSERI